MNDHVCILQDKSCVTKVDHHSDAVPTEYVVIDSVVENSTNGSVIPILQLVQQLLR